MSTYPFTLTVPDNSKITSFPGPENTSYATQYKIGESIHLTRLYKFTGINPENGVPTVEDVNQDGAITAAGDKQFLQDTDPDYYGGLHNSFRYRNWQLDVFFYFEKRPFQEGYLKTYFYPAGYIGKNIPRSLAGDYWTPENPGGTLPGLTTTTTSPIGYAYFHYYTESSAVYTDASYIRLKNVSLAYTLPKLLVFTSTCFRFIFPLLRMNRTIIFRTITALKNCGQTLTVLQIHTSDCAGRILTRLKPNISGLTIILSSSIFLATSPG